MSLPLETIILWYRPKDWIQPQASVNTELVGKTVQVSRPWPAGVHSELLQHHSHIRRILRDSHGKHGQAVSKFLTRSHRSPLIGPPTSPCSPCLRHATPSVHLHHSTQWSPLLYVFCSSSGCPQRFGHYWIPGHCLRSTPARPEGPPTTTAQYLPKRSQLWSKVWLHI